MAGTVVAHDAISGAVVRALSTIAAGQPIYNERMLQDFDEPCFFVFETSVSEEPGLDRYCFREHRIEVSYYPVTEALSHHSLLSQWRETLMLTLRKIMVDAYVENSQTVRLPVSARNAECRFIEDHITYYASYRIRCRRSADSGTTMAEFTQTQHIR